MPIQSCLAGVRVLDFSRLLPGPYCTWLLAELGAEVIKIESPLAGDGLRHAPPGQGFEGMFDTLNHNKRMLGLNYRHPLGRAVVLRLARRADVLVESFRPGALARWGLDAAALQAANPGLIYCALSGYGQSGPYRDRAGHDLNYLAAAGLLGFGRPAGEAPAMPNVPMADLAGGLLAAVRIMGALLERGRTGQGALLDVALVDGPLTWLAALGALQRSEAGPARPPLAGGLPCYQIYRTADEQAVTLAALEPVFWGDFCHAAGRPDLIPLQRDTATAGELAALFRTRPLADWLALAEAGDFCLEPVRSPAAAAAQPAIQLRQAELGLAAPQVAPGLGADTRAVLAELDLSEAEWRELEMHHVVRGG
ncbi:MAG: CoA transferase [Anaerolineales bacterium]|nr:CoA transferase [Anaerolineales bacterium]